MAMKRKSRPNPKTFSIIDKCPGCQREFGWDSCGDFYVGSVEQTQHLTPAGENPKTITLFICPDCDVTFAIGLQDNRGGEIFVPSTKEL